MKTVNINTGTAEELTAIIHIGVKRAEKIIANRPFKDLHELSLILGLGEFRMRDILTEGIAVV